MRIEIPASEVDPLASRQAADSFENRYILLQANLPTLSSFLCGCIVGFGFPPQHTEPSFRVREISEQLA